MFPKPPWIGESDAVAVHAAVSLYAKVLQTQREGKSVSLEAQLWSRLLSVLGSLGLTPADRGKMTVPKANDQKDKWAGIL
jgi:hypothetical protein